MRVLLELNDQQLNDFLFLDLPDIRETHLNTAKNEVTTDD